MKKSELAINATVVDLFCGAGGLTQGFVKEKFNVVAGIDFDETCGYPFEKNNKTRFIYADVTKLDAKRILALYPKGHRKILVGCAPCQPFSLYNHKNGKDRKKQRKDAKWELLHHFADIIEKVNPEIISMENVPQLVKFKEGKVFNDFVKRLEKYGYAVSWLIVNAQDYGVPQRRKRLVLFGSKFAKVNLIDRTIRDGKYITVRDAIGHLPPVEDGVHHPDDFLHRARKLSKLNMKRIRATREGGFWREWDRSLWLECHKKKTGGAFRSVYGRMKWDDVAPTITTYCTGLGNGRFGHPKQERAITLREAALLQGFPQNYDFINPKAKFSSPGIARQIGNAVPIPLAIAIAKSIKKHLHENGD